MPGRRAAGLDPGFAQPRSVSVHPEQAQAGEAALRVRRNPVLARRPVIERTFRSDQSDLSQLPVQYHMEKN